MLDILKFILLLIVPGFIASAAFDIACGIKKKSCCYFIITALVFDLLIFIVNLAGLHYFKVIWNFEQLAWDLSHLRFAFKYGILSIIVGIILAIIFGLLCRLFICKFKKRYIYRDDEE